MDCHYGMKIYEITTFLKDEVMGTVAPWYVGPGGAGAVKVLVSKKDVDRAKPIVQKFLIK